MLFQITLTKKGENMKNCADCVNMRVRIPIVDGLRKKGIIDYRRGVSRCMKGVIIDKAGNEKQFRMYDHRQRPKAWDEAKRCGEYNESEKSVSSELVDTIVKAYRIVHGK